MNLTKWLNKCEGFLKKKNTQTQKENTQTQIDHELRKWKNQQQIYKRNWIRQDRKKRIHLHEKSE